MEEKQKRIYWNRNWQFLKGFEESYLGLQTIDAAQELESFRIPCRRYRCIILMKACIREFSHTGRCSGRMRTGRESGFCLRLRQRGIVHGDT